MYQLCFFNQIFVCIFYYSAQRTSMPSLYPLRLVIIIASSSFSLNLMWFRLFILFVCLHLHMLSGSWNRIYFQFYSGFTVRLRMAAARSCFMATCCR